MKTGILTTPFAGEPLEKVADFAENHGIVGLEIPVGPGVSHLDVAALTEERAGRLRESLEARGLEITALAFHADTTSAGREEAFQDRVKEVIVAAARLGTPILSMCTGMPVDGLTRPETIRQVLPDILRPILDYAGEKGVKVAVENTHYTCLRGLNTFECLFETFQDPHFGLTYDPAHLYHQECDHLLPITEFGDRLFHVHAKDILIDYAKRARVGIYGDGWWRYVIPGFGHIHWGEFVSHLRAAGYNETLCIEHEDACQTREEGFIRGAWILGQFC